MPEIQYPKNSNSDTAFVVQEGGQKNRVLMTVEDNDGTVEYSDSPNSTSAYVTIDGKKHRALLTAPQDTSTLEMSDNPNSTKGYVTVDGKKHRVVLTATIAGGGTPINNQDISVTANGEYTAEEGYTGLGTVSVSVPNPSTGTKSITANGIYDVTNFASADVQVPTTAPEIYRVFRSNNGVLENSISTPFIPLPSTVTDVDVYALYRCYYNTPSSVLSGAIDLSSLTTLSSMASCSEMFKNCTGITSVNLSSLTTLSGSSACSNMFQGCTGLTSINLNSLSSTSSSACSSMFLGCTSLTSVNLSNLTTISGQNACKSMFEGCTSLTSISLSGLTTISGNTGCSEMFKNCTSLTSVNLSNLTVISGNTACGSMFQGCTSLTSLSFPALTSTSFGTRISQFTSIISGVTGCTIHFPSNLDPQGGSTVISSLSGYPTFGGTNTVLAFDLPATE